MVYPTLYIYRFFFHYLKFSFEKMNYDNQFDKMSNFFLKTIKFMGTIHIIIWKNNKS
jgi:hypothetical protein